MATEMMSKRRQTNGCAPPLHDARQTVSQIKSRKTADRIRTGGAPEVQIFSCSTSET